MDQTLAQKARLFVALGAPPRAKGLSASYLSTLVESHPKFIYLLFGRHAMLPSTLMWMKVGTYIEASIAHSLLCASICVCVCVFIISTLPPMWMLLMYILWTFDPRPQYMHTHMPT